MAKFSYWSVQTISSTANWHNMGDNTLNIVIKTSCCINVHIVGNTLWTNSQGHHHVFDWKNASLCYVIHLLVLQIIKHFVGVCFTCSWWPCSLCKLLVWTSLLQIQEVHWTSTLHLCEVFPFNHLIKPSMNYKYNMLHPYMSKKIKDTQHVNLH